jgi:hypothetical protein
MQARRRSLPILLTVAAALASPAVTLPAAADPPGTLVVPLQNLDRPRAANLVGAGTHGFAYVPEADDGTLPNIVWQPYDGSAPTTVPRPAGATTGDLSVADDSVAYRTGPQNASTVHLLDMAAGGAESTITLPSPSRYYGPTDGGVYYDNVDQNVGGYGNHLFIKYADGHTADLGDIGTGALVAWGSASIAIDSGGASFVYGTKDGMAHLAYADTAAQTLRDVVAGSGIATKPTLTAGNVLWHEDTGPDASTSAHDHGIFWQARSGGTIHAVNLTVDTSFAWFTQIGSSTLAWRSGAASPLQTVPMDGGSPAASGSTVYSWAAAPDGSVVAEEGGPTAHSIANLGDGPSQQLVQLPPLPAPVTSIALSGRRLVVTDHSASPSWLGSEQLTPTGPLAVASTTTLEPDSALPDWCPSCAGPLASGHRTFYAAGSGYVLRDGNETTSQLPTSSLGGYSIATAVLSGRSLYASNWTGTGIWDADIGSWKMSVPAGSAVHGSTVWEPVRDSNTGLNTSFNAVNVDTGAQLANFALPTPCHVTQASAVGQWVGWVCFDGTSAIHNTVTAADVPLSTQYWMLGDNYVAYVADDGSGGGVLTVRDLTNAGADPVPLANFPFGTSWAVDNGGGQAVTYADKAGIHVLPVPVAASSLALLDDTTPAHFAPAQDAWAPKWDLSKPATWTLTVTQGDTVVRQLSGSADDGGARPVWDGIDGAGHSVAFGDYSWTFSATAADGDASTYTRSGTVTVGSPPTVTITSEPPSISSSPAAAFAFTTAGLDPADVTTACSIDGAAAVSCTSPFPASGLANGSHTFRVDTADTHGGGGSATYTWTVDTAMPTVTAATMAPFTVGSSLAFTYAGRDVGSGVASYDVKFRRAGPSGAWSADQYPAAWQHITAAKVARTELAGYTDCFSVRVRDKAGNTSAWSPQRCAAVVLDDRSLTMSAGWSRRTGTPFYLHTETQTTTLNMTLTRGSSTVDRLALLVTRCATCGSLRIDISGKYLTTVSLYSRTTQYRSLVVLPAFTNRSGIVHLRVATSGKLVQVDALGMSRA